MPSRKNALLLAWWLGLYQPPDRRALRRIWETLVDDRPGFCVLFAGVRPYTRGLTRAPKRATVVTIDPDPRMRFFGAKRHRITTLQRADQRVDQRVGQQAEGPFDLAVVNGVLGWGIDTADEADAALWATARAMRRGATLVLGINEERLSTPKFDGLAALADFRPVAPPPFHEQRVVVPSPFEGSHTFLFFERL